MTQIFLIFIAAIFIASCSNKNGSDYSKEIARATNYFNNRQFGASIEILKKIEAENPDNPLVQFMLGTAELRRDVYDDQGGVKNAAKANDGLSHLAKAVATVPANAKYGLSYSVVLAEVGQCNKALPIFDRYYEDLKHEQWGSSKIIYVRYAQCLLESRSEREALSVLSDLEQSGSVDNEILKQAAAVREKINKK